MQHSHPSPRNIVRALALQGQHLQDIVQHQLNENKKSQIIPVSANCGSTPGGCSSAMHERKRVTSDPIDTQLVRKELANKYLALRKIVPSTDTTIRTENKFGIENKYGCILMYGREFNEKYKTKSKGRRFYKILSSSENHHDFQYRTGENVDHLRFNPTGCCQPGGLYFTEFRYIDHFVGVCIAEVSIADDALVYEEGIKWKTNKLNLGPERIPLLKCVTPMYRQTLRRVYYKGHIFDFEDENYEGLIREAVIENPLLIAFVSVQCEALCCELIRENPYYIGMVPAQTETLSLIAVTMKPKSLKFVHSPTLRTCLGAVRSDGLALKYVVEQTSEICLEAVRQNGLALQFVHRQQRGICHAAVIQNALAIRFVQPEFKDEFMSALVGQTLNTISTQL